MPGYDPNDPANQKTYPLSATEPAFLDVAEERYIRDYEQARAMAVEAWTDVMIDKIREEEGYKLQPARIRRVRAHMDQMALRFVDEAIRAIAYNEKRPEDEVQEELRVEAWERAEVRFGERVVLGYEKKRSGK